MVIRIFDANQRFQPKSGYGLMAKQIGKNLEVLGHTVKFFPDDNSGQDIILWIRPPHYIKYSEFKTENKNVFYTMHEKEDFTGWKEDWPNLLNKCNAVITPTQWNKDVFIKNGVTVPIYVIPLGVNSREFTGNKTYQFSILALHDALGSDSSRENWKDTIKAYFDAFYDNHQMEVLLTIKSYNIKREEYFHYLNSLKAEKDADKFPMIDIVDINLESMSLNSLYGKHWMFIKNANREGWSLPLLEAISCGLIVAHTDIPVLNWTDGYKKRRLFKNKDVEALKDILLDEFHHWRKEKIFINKFAWRNCAKEVENVLLSV